MGEITFADLVAHAVSCGHSQSYVEEQLKQGWLPAGRKVGVVGGGSHSLYPSRSVRAFDVLVDAKEHQGYRGDGLRFWLWLYGASLWDEKLAGRMVADGVRTFVGEMLEFQSERLRRITSYKPGGRPRKDGQSAGIGDEDIYSLDNRIDQKRAEKLETYMSDVAYKMIDDVLTPITLALGGLSLSPDLLRRTGKLFIANAAGIPQEFLGDEATFTKDDVGSFGEDPGVIPRLIKGEPGNWNVKKLLQRAAPDTWEEARRGIFSSPGMIYTSYTEAIAEATNVSLSLRRQCEYFRHPRLSIRAVIIGTFVCDGQRRRSIANKRVKRAESSSSAPENAASH